MNCIQYSLRMKLLHELAFVVIVTAKGILMKNMASTNVISVSFCESSLSEGEKVPKDALEKVHSYAELKKDPNASLMETFTICSALMIGSCPMSIGEPSFFTFLAKDKNQLFAPITFPKTILSTLKFYYLKGASEIVVDKTSPIFPNMWAKNCLAVNATSGLLQWVIDGTHVMTTVSEEVKSSKEKPNNLSKKVVLGARAYAGNWRSLSSKVTDLNIFSSALSVHPVTWIQRKSHRFGQSAHVD